MSESSREWIGVSDLMAGLMMVFLFIAVLFMVKIEEEKADIEKKMSSVEKITTIYKDYEQELNAALWREFGKDLKRWDAEILDDNVIRFKSPDVLFKSGKSEIKQRFKNILDEFFPRYVRLLGRDQFKLNIDEVRIEGHTSSVWAGATTLDARYLKNADLSQARSFAVLAYCFELSAIERHKEWLTQVLRANGLAFAKPVAVAGVENPGRSRRVEFRVKTKAKELIEEIIRATQTNET